MNRRVSLSARWRDRAAQHWPTALVAVTLGCAMLPLARSPAVFGSLAHAASPGTFEAARRAQAREATEWPTHWRSQALRPLALSAVEHRFADRFPGSIARFAVADGSQLVLREVTRPTRMLHPAADCWRGIGWRIEATRLRTDADALLWRCFEAVRDGQRVRVCERIVDAQGRAFTDTSAWFWDATLQRSRGPWQAVTRVEPLT
jgi:hypothetical protein